jgi:hypothetical protein
MWPPLPFLWASLVELFFFLFFFRSEEVGSISKPSPIMVPIVLLSNFSNVSFCFLHHIFIFLHFLLFSASLSLYIYVPSFFLGFLDLSLSHKVWLIWLASWLEFPVIACLMTPTKNENLVWCLSPAITYTHSWELMKSVGCSVS